MVDVGTGQLLDVFEGRDAKDLRAWMARMPLSWLDSVQVVSVDPHEGYRSAVVNPDPLTLRSSPLAGVTIVVDPFLVPGQVLLRRGPLSHGGRRREE